jgi:TolB-like protein
VPFEGDTPFTVGIKHKSEMPKDPKEINVQIPEDLDRLILRCLEKDRDKRYRSAEDLRMGLEKIEQGIPTTEHVISKRKTTTGRQITVTFGPKKILIPALAVAALAVAMAVWLVFFKKESGLRPEQRRSIAVISFENQTGDKTFDYLKKAIPNLLISSLEQSKYLRVTTWERMDDLLRQMGKAGSETIDKESGFELCRKDGVETIVVGSFVKAEDMFVTDVKVLDAFAASSKSRSGSSAERSPAAWAYPNARSKRLGPPRPMCRHPPWRPTTVSSREKKLTRRSIMNKLGNFWRMPSPSTPILPRPTSTWLEPSRTWAIRRPGSRPMKKQKSSPQRLPRRRDFISKRPMPKRSREIPRSDCESLKKSFKSTPRKKRRTLSWVPTIGVKISPSRLSRNLIERWPSTPTMATP